MTYPACNNDEADEVEFTADYGSAVAISRKRQATVRHHRPPALAIPHFVKEMTMTCPVLNSTEIEELEFTASYGTSVFVALSRHPTTRSHPPEMLGETGDGATSSRQTAASNDDSSARPDNDARNSGQPPARRTMRLAAAPSGVKSRRSQPRPANDMNRRRKAA